MAQWQPLKTYTKSTLMNMGGGVNRGLPEFGIEDNQQSYGINMDARKYPVQSVMPGRSTYALALTTPYGIGQRSNSQLHCIDGNTWKYWSTATSAYVDITTGLTGTGNAYLGDFVAGTYRYTILMNGTESLYWPSTSTALAFSDTNLPVTEKFTVHQGRVYTLKGATLAYSGLNLPTDWTAANDAGSITITNAQGDGTALYEYNNYVLVFTDYSCHQLSGSGPDDFMLNDIEGGVGCISHKSITDCQGALYWVNYDGVYRADGTLAMKKISNPVNPYIEGINTAYRTSIVSGAIGDTVYISIPYGSTATANNYTLKYNATYDAWNVENEGFEGFVTIGKNLFGLKADGHIVKVRDTSVVTNCGSAISWEFITKAFVDKGIDNDKSLISMDVAFNMTTDSTALSIGLSTDLTATSSDAFTTVYSATNSSSPQNTKVAIPTTDIQNAKWYKIRFAGSGPVDIYSLQKKIREKVV